ncbi:hypothetical protein [Massilia consociata]|uniref:Uncharacterized protein n=1 Tax=Massilia consociata TaxID=760117 RepID=A0ABV6FFD1_9BURK
MDIAATTEIYRIRPDIFVKAGEDRIYINFRDDHYVLRVHPDMVDSVFRFLDLNDGATPLAVVLEAFPEAQRGKLQSLLEFLTNKKAAFCVEQDAGTSDLSPVADTLLYLAEYGDHPARLFRHFVGRRVLLVGSGYPLAGCIKTLARLGIRQLDVLLTHTHERNRWPAEDLRRSFCELRRWPDASLTFVQAAEATQRHEDVLHLDIDSDPAVHEAVARSAAGARHLYVIVSAGQACMSLQVATPQTARMGDADEACSPPQQLVAGAFAALAYFDDLCQVRSLNAGSYLHYSLDAHGRVRSAPHVRLSAIEALGAGTVPRAKPGLLAFRESHGAPLFPLGEPSELTEANSYIKLFSAALPATAPADRRLIAAGFSRADCERRLLLQLIAEHGVWFDGGSEDEQHAVRRYLQACRQAAQVRALLLERDRLSPCDAGWEDESREEAYLEFCISASFGERVRWFGSDTGHAEFARCLVLGCGDLRLYLPHAGVAASSDRLELLFAMHAALWRRAKGMAPAVDIVLPAALNPFGMQP